MSAENVEWECFSLIVPRIFLFADPYVVLRDDGRVFCEIPGGRWFYRDLRICDPGGPELARLCRKGWWWPGPARFELFRGRNLEARIEWLGPGQMEVIMAVGERQRFKKTERWRDRYELTRGERVVGHLTRGRGRGERRTFALEVAHDVDAISTVAGCLALDQSRRQVSG